MTERFRHEILMMATVFLKRKNVDQLRNCFFHFNFLGAGFLKDEKTLRKHCQKKYVQVEGQEFQCE